MSYFVTIKTQHHEEDTAVNIHNQKLNNYLTYGIATTDDLVFANKYQKLAKKKEVESQCVGTTMKNNYFVITSILCCEDEANEGTY